MRRGIVRTVTITSRVVAARAVEARIGQHLGRAGRLLFQGCELKEKYVLVKARQCCSGAGQGADRLSPIARQLTVDFGRCSPLAVEL